MGLCIHGWPKLDPWICPRGAMLRKTLKAISHTSIISISKRFDVLPLHACMRAVHNLSRCPKRITFYCRQCAEWNADFIGAATAYEWVDDKYVVLRVSIVVPVHEIRPRASAVASVLMCHVWLLLAHLPKTKYSIVLKHVHVCVYILFSCLALRSTYCRSIFCDRAGSPTSRVHVRNLFWIYSWVGNG